jgi:hypothetical protein
MNRAMTPWLSAITFGLIVLACNPTTIPPTAAPSAIPSEVPSAAPESAPVPSPTFVPTSEPAATAAPSASPVAAVPLCSPSHLAARITRWDAGQGHRTANVEVTNTASATCKIRGLDQAQLVDGHGSVIINGQLPVASTFLVMAPGSVLATLVDADNYCGPAPIAPVTVAFIYPGGVGRFVATPVSKNDLSGVPPCLGAGSGARVEMQPWAP